MTSFYCYSMTTIKFKSQDQLMTTRANNSLKKIYQNQTSADLQRAPISQNITTQNPLSHFLIFPSLPLPLLGLLEFSGL